MDSISTQLKVNIDRFEKGHISWLIVDEGFYEARGASWALLHILQAIKVEFGNTFLDKPALNTLDKIIHEMKNAISPKILAASGVFGTFSNASTHLANHITRANASALVLRDILDEKKTEEISKNYTNLQKVTTMEQPIEMWRALPAEYQTAITDMLVTVLIILIAIKIALSLQKKFANSEIDQLLAMPGIHKKTTNKQVFFSALLSWLTALILCILALGFYFPDLNFFKKYEYGDFLLQGWLLTIAYIVALIFVRKIVQALVDLLSTPGIEKILQRFFFKDEQKQNANDWNEAFSSMTTFLGTILYSFTALLIGMFIITEALQLKVLNQLINVLLAGVIILISVKITQYLQKKFVGWEIDQRVAMPGLNEKINEQPIFFATLLSWLTGIVLCLTTFEIFFSHIEFFKHFKYGDLFVRGWILIGCYAGFLVLIRVFVQSLIDFINTPFVQEMLLHLFIDKKKNQNSIKEWKESVPTVTNFFGIALYSLVAVVLGILLILDVLKLETLSLIISTFLSGLGQLSIALIMIFVGLISYRKIQTHSDKYGPEESNKYFSVIVFSGCLLLAIAILMTNVDSLFAPLLWLVIFVGITLVFSKPLRASIPDVLAGLYLRVGDYHRTKLHGSLEGVILLKIGWESSIVGINKDNARIMSNRIILETGIVKENVES